MNEAFYVPDGDTFVPTELTRGPWDPRTQHGGPPAALLGRQIEHAAAQGDLLLTRLTVELFRPVPIAPLQVTADVVRAGRSVTSVDGWIRSGGKDIARGQGLLIRTTDLEVPQPVADPPPPPGPQEGEPRDFFPTGQSIGYHTAMEYRFIDGGFVELGPSTVWMRMRVPLVAGEAPSPWQRVLCAADSGNGVSAELDFQEFIFINPDLSVHLHRVPLGEWVCLDARTVVEPSGVGLATSMIFDEHGPLGHGLQSLYIAAR
jgi:hypothetical protein